MYYPSNIITITSTTCKTGHTFTIDPPVQLLVCSKDMETWECTEDGFHFLVQGIDIPEILTNFGNQICNRYKTYCLKPHIINVSKEILSFKKRVARTF